MLIRFFLMLRAAGVPVSITEFLALLEALEARLIGLSAEDFYWISRAILVKDERHYDRFDRVFAAHFKGAELALEALLAADIPAETLHSPDSHKIIPPLHGALLKNEQDVHLFEQLLFLQRRGR